MQPAPVQITPTQATPTHKVVSDEIMFKDVPIPTLNGFLGLAIQWLLLPFLMSCMFITYEFGGALIVIGIIVQILLVILWFLMFQ